MSDSAAIGRNSATAQTVPATPKPSIPITPAATASSSVRKSPSQRVRRGNNPACTPAMSTP